MNQTLSFVRATMQRAADQGAKTVEVQIRDLQELLPAIESALSRQRAEKPMKPAGWVRPSALRAMNGERKKSTKISRFKSEEFNLQLYFCDNLHEKHAESIRLLAAKEDSERWASEQRDKA